MSRIEWCVAAITFLLVATGVEGSGDDDSEHDDEMLNVIKIVLLCFCWFYLLTICFRA